MHSNIPRKTKTMIVFKKKLKTPIAYLLKKKTENIVYENVLFYL